MIYLTDCPERLVLDVDKIQEGLWQGSVPPGGTILKEKGFDVVVLCADDFQFLDQPDRYPGLEVLRCPYDDYHELPDHQLAMIVDTAFQVAKHVRAGKKVLVTCAAGLNRSGLVTGLALQLLTKWSGRAVLTHVRSRRNMALCNPFFAGCIMGDYEPLVRELYAVWESDWYKAGK
jgi:hypothetical protein